MKTLFRIVLFLILPFSASTQNDWYINLSPGVDFIPPEPLIITQEGYGPVSFWANYESSPLRSPVYYSSRIGFIKGEKGWEVEMNHLKIYLKNTPDAIQRFSISHGYNQFFINRVKKSGRFRIKTGAGIVLAHPENTVRNLKLDESLGILGWGYYIAGPAVQKAIAAELKIVGRLYMLAELKATLAYANVPVADGRAHAPVFALHLQLGPGFYVIKRRASPE